MSNMAQNLFYSLVIFLYWFDQHKQWQGLLNIQATHLPWVVWPTFSILKCSLEWHYQVTIKRIFSPKNPVNCPRAHGEWGCEISNLRGLCADYPSVIGVCHYDCDLHIHMSLPSCLQDTISSNCYHPELPLNTFQNLHTLLYTFGDRECFWLYQVFEPWEKLSVVWALLYFRGLNTDFFGGLLSSHVGLSVGVSVVTHAP